MYIYTHIRGGARIRIRGRRYNYINFISEIFESFFSPNVLRSPDLVKGGKTIANANRKVKDATHFLLTRKLGMGDVDHLTA